VREVSLDGVEIQIFARGDKNIADHLADKAQTTFKTALDVGGAGRALRR
jgi:hypothetical protein